MDRDFTFTCFHLCNDILLILCSRCFFYICGKALWYSFANYRTNDLAGLISYSIIIQLKTCFPATLYLFSGWPLDGVAAPGASVSR